MKKHTPYILEINQLQNVTLSIIEIRYLFYSHYLILLLVVFNLYFVFITIFYQNL